MIRKSLFIKLYSAMLVLAITSCASLPSHVIIAPDITASSAINHHNKLAQLNVVDMRTANHIVQIVREGDAAIILSAQQRLEDTLSESLTQQWLKQGLTFDANASNQISIAIEQALIRVNQETFKYQAQTHIILKVTLNNGEETLTTTFKNSGNSNGPLQADIAVLERNFNQRLTNVLQQILMNEQLNHFFK
ncbi:hypothetical protein NBRC116592_18940 [Colwellia sp. KU-HH00111]|uniref:YajG family lipoprotein n=1 Tax=Colwellia sp. KU-HH00111 TaxID=3127652 RepID=UPI00310851BD